MNLKFLRQYNTGRKIGALLDTYQRTAGVISAIQYVTMIIILYTTSARPFLDIYYPWVTFWMFMLIAVVMVLVVMVIVYMIAAPSTFAFHNQQLWKHDNPMRFKLEKIEKKQVLLDEKLDDILELLNEDKK